MVWATRFELAFTPWDVPPVPSLKSVSNILQWSGRPDLNWRPRSPEPRALPTAPRPDIFILSRKPQTLLKSNYGIQ